MRKRTKGLFVILVLAAVGFMLYPTVQWYFVWDAEQREEASYTIQTIKDKATNFADQGVFLFNEAFEADRTAEFTVTATEANDTISNEVREEAFTALKDEAVKRLKEQNVKYEVLTYDYVKRAFANLPKGITLEVAEENVRIAMTEFLEGVKREALFAAKDKSERIIQLGLDLAGGVSYVLEANVDSYAQEQDAINKQLSYDEALAEAKEADENATIDFETFEDYEKYSLSGNLDKIMEIAVEQITSRVDIYGASEPDIRRLGDSWIQVDLPGAKDPERLRRLLMGSGSLNFHVVDNEETAALNTWLAENRGTEEYITTMNAFVDGSELKVPTAAGVSAYNMVVGAYEKDAYREDQRVGWLVVTREPGMPGSQVQKATAYRSGDTGEIATSFQLTSEGQDLFGEMTNGATEEAPISISVIMDGKSKMNAAASQQLRSATLQVSGRGIGFEEAQDFAQLLELGSKEVGISILSSDVIGSGLGADYVESGITALAWGLLLVVIFMVCYYKVGGLVAVFALATNLLIMAGLLSQIQLTLTLAGMAGFILTIGMSVDANVIIFERIKEEMRLGKSPKSSVIAGFQKAFWTILDSNITTFISALVLSYFGSSTVKGFATILAVGIFSSMFTALFVSRLLLDINVETFKVKRLQITWRRK